jgi:formylmethanofuran dehydrogenase subunit E
MTAAAAAQLSTLQQLLADLEAIENNFHGLADPQLAIGTKMREILTETVKVVHEVQSEALKATEMAGNAEALASSAKDAAQGVAEQLSGLEQRIAKLEPKA